MLRRTPLYDAHQAAGATFTPFAGYEMPVHYGSIKDEHQAVRSGVGLFDVSHMSNIWVTGPRAAAALARVCPMDPEALEDGKGKYTVVLREDGTIMDDCFVFCIDPQRFFVIPNAGMNEEVAAHLRRHTPEAEVEDVTPQWAILALQGPGARSVLKRASADPGPRFHRITRMEIAGVECLVSGTGYTGEKGVEIYVASDRAASVWAHLLKSQEPPVRPIGLGARDTLRLEKGYCLAGHEFAGGRTPLEAGLAWAIDMQSRCIGMDAVRGAKDEAHPRLWGIRLEKGIPRQGQAVHRDDVSGPKVGIVTSGTMSPTLGTGIGLAYLDAAQERDAVVVDVRGRGMPATVVKPPFV